MISTDFCGHWIILKCNLLADLSADSYQSFVDVSTWNGHQKQKELPSRNIFGILFQTLFISFKSSSIYSFQWQCEFDIFRSHPRNVRRILMIEIVKRTRSNLYCCRIVKLKINLQLTIQRDRVNHWTMFFVVFQLFVFCCKKQHKKDIETSVD